METKLTFAEELAVANAISLRITDLSNFIHECLPQGLDPSVLREVRENLVVAYRKLTGVNYKLNT